MKQKVEILKALYRGAKILILDEPTAVLTPQETAELFVQLKKLKDAGLTIVFISHKLGEVKAICDRITIMRGGKDMGVYNVADVTEQEISKLMVGRDIVQDFEKPYHEVTKQILDIRGLICKNEQGKHILNDIYLSIPNGKILGIAGVDGNGQNDLVRTIMGESPICEGTITIDGTNTSGMNINAIRSLSVGYVPEDRMSEGVAGDASISDNIIANRYDSTDVGDGRLFNKQKTDTLTQSLIMDYYILCKNGEQPINMLSGGNMQKVVVARECSLKPLLFIAEQPTRGVDVGSAQFIHQNILSLREQGSAVLLVSADLNEVIDLSDHLIVMFEGEIVAYFEDPSLATEEELGLAMLGIERHSEEEIRRAFDGQE